MSHGVSSQGTLGGLIAFMRNFMLFAIYLHSFFLFYILKLNPTIIKFIYLITFELNPIVSWMYAKIVNN